MCKSETQCCDACSREVQSDLLKQASMPSGAAIAAVDDHFDFEEPAIWLQSTPDDLIDRQLYCPACRWRVNLKRGLLIAVWCVAMPVLARMLLDWL